ncbi:hypothetical protein F5Y16DRAFT_377050 [Xylariaceae sp. FL0255]|nr:hypothetical protein F5Y16DRAFT_377050 [Xylariaceae sp. FL0255]
MMNHMLCYPFDAAVMGEPTVVRNAKASQACLSCRKQKRKCDKALPSCALCTRMSRFCDYSDYPPNPTVEDLEVLRSRLTELEAKLKETDRQPSSESISPPSIDVYHARSSPSYSSEVGWQFHAGAFDPAPILDARFFRDAHLSIARSSVEIPQAVLNYVGDLDHLQHVMTTYFAEIHPWFPIIRKKRKSITSLMWDFNSPETSLLLLSMMLMADRPAEGMLPSARNYLYKTTKHFLSRLEDAGVTSLIYLQAIVLIALYEYSHGIYPAAWMTVGQCVRYADFIGLPSYKESNSMLGQCATWLEAEERRRAWWAVYVLDKAVCTGSDKRCLCSEPSPTEILPVPEEAWDSGDASLAVQHKISSPSTNEPVSPFARICQSALLISKGLRYCQKAKMIKLQHELPDRSEASCLIETAFSLSACLANEVLSAPSNYPALVAARSLSYSAIYKIIGAHQPDSSSATSPTPSLQETQWANETLATQAMTFETQRKASADVSDMAASVSTHVRTKEEVQKLSPFVLGALYSAGVTFSWWREQGYDSVSITSLELVKKCLLRVSSRWSLATEYLTLLEQQEMNAMSRSFPGPLTSMPLLTSTMGI